VAAVEDLESAAVPVADAGEEFLVRHGVRARRPSRADEFESYLHVLLFLTHFSASRFGAASVCCPGSQFGTPRRKEAMATLAFNHEEIVPRALKPALYELDGISRAAVEAHYKLYQGYVNKRNEILGKLADVELAAANQVYSEVRALKIEYSFAVGGIKNHEIYFEHLGGHGGDPDGPIGTLIRR